MLKASINSASPWPRCIAAKALRLALSALLLALAAVAPKTAWADAERMVQRIAEPPLGLPALPYYSAVPPTAAQVELGRKLFFDARLSRDGSFACASCHVPEQAFALAGQAAPPGRNGEPLRRNAPSLLNVAYARALFADGRAASLEQQVLGPLLAAEEMGNASADQVIARLRATPDYDGRFEAAFGAGPSVAGLTRAIASYERTLLAGNAPFDRWYYGGDAAAVSESAKRGFRLFNEALRCADCHKIGTTSALFTNNAFHFIGTGLKPRQTRAREARSAFLGDPRGHLTLAALAETAEDDGALAVDLGRQEATGDPKDQWAYRTPSLRNVALTPPYMHDGSLETLADVVRYYDYPNVWHVRLDRRIKPLGLSDQQQADLIAFLESLTSDDLALLVQEARGAQPPP